MKHQNVIYNKIYIENLKNIYMFVLHYIFALHYILALGHGTFKVQKFISPAKKIENNVVTEVFNFNISRSSSIIGDLHFIFVLVHWA